MAEKETRVLYKAIADFSALSRSVRAAKKNVDELRRAEDRLNSESAAASGIATAAQGKHAKAVKADSAEVGKHSGAVRTDSQVVRDSTVAFIESASAKRSSTKATKDLTSATTEAGTVSRRSLTPSSGRPTLTSTRKDSWMLPGSPSAKDLPRSPD